MDEDSALYREIEAALNQLLGQKVKVHHTSSGEEAVAQVRDWNPDFVFCAVQLPGADGFQLCREFRKISKPCALILLSPYDPDHDFAGEAREAGADFYLSKPLKRGELFFVVNSFLRVAHLNDLIYQKNKQLEGSLEKLKVFHKKLAGLNYELHLDKRRLGTNLKEMTSLNSQLQEKNSQISAMVEEMGKRFESTEGLLVNIIELHQDDHRGHSERVAEIATFIAEKMKLTDYQIRNIRTAARLHELGIVALPTKEKRVEAMDEATNRLRTKHPLVGEMLLKGFPGFELIADIIRHLHENVDGSGSPDGLYGDRIPAGARIISAASFFDHERIFRPESSLTEIMATLDKQSGIIFDEQVLNFLGEYADSLKESGEDKFMDCSVFALSEGMELASDIYSESGINLLRKGTVLNQEILNQILKFHTVDPIAGNVKIRQAS